ncbi:MAG: WD40 repeat domain-containing protein [Chryseolinea sp.]
MKVQVQKLHTLRGHRDSVYALQPSSQDDKFFSAAGDGMVVLWDQQTPEDGTLIAKLPNSVYSLHFQRQTDILIAGQNYEGIHLLDWKNKKEIGSLKLTGAAIFDIQSYGRYLFVATGEGFVFKIEYNDLMVKNQLQSSDKSARTLAINEARGEIAVGFSDHYIRIFDLDDLTLKREWLAHKNSVFTLKYSADGKLLYSGSRDARINVWDATSEYEHVEEIAAHLYAINHLDFSPDGKHFVTCSMDRSVKIWQTGKVKLLKVIDKARHAGHGTSVNRVLWSSFHNQLLSASDDRTISIWDIKIENQSL